VLETFTSQSLGSINLRNIGLSEPIDFIINLPDVSVLRLDNNSFVGPLPTLDGLSSVVTKEYEYKKLVMKHVQVP
jgi:hypothetical protein